MDLPSPGNLRHSAGRILTCLIVTHSDIIASRPQHRSLRYGLYLIWNALLPLDLRRTRCFGVLLTPDHYWCEGTRPVSYYALFKWWLLLSQHPGCHCTLTSFLTRQNLGALAGDLGCFPLDPEAYPSGTVSRVSRYGIRSLAPQDSRVGLQANSVSLPP